LSFPKLSPGVSDNWWLCCFCGKISEISSKLIYLSNTTPAPFLDPDNLSKSADLPGSHCFSMSDAMEDIQKLPTGHIQLGSSAPNTPRSNAQPSSDDFNLSSPIMNTIRASQQNLHANNKVSDLNGTSNTTATSNFDLSTPFNSASTHRPPNRITKRPSEVPMEPPVAKFMRQKEPSSIKAYIDRMMSDCAQVVSMVAQPEYRNGFVRLLSMMEQISSGHPDISASNGIINAANQLERLLTKVTKQTPSTNAVLQPQTSTAGSAATSNSNSSQRGRPVSTPSNNLFSSCFNDTQNGKNVFVLDPKPTKKQQSDLKKMDKQRRTVILIKQSLESFSNINSLELRTKINAELT
jgi:hypothetical protein